MFDSDNMVFNEIAHYDVCLSTSQVVLYKGIRYSSWKEYIMIPIRDFINRHSLPIYFILVFIISWGAILIFAGPDGIPVSPDQTVILGTAILLGPTVAGILMIGFTSGWAGSIFQPFRGKALPGFHEFIEPSQHDDEKQNITYSDNYF